MPISVQCYGAMSILLSTLVQGNTDATKCILDSLKSADLQQSRTFREKNTKRFKRVYGDAYKQICEEISPSFETNINILYNYNHDYDLYDAYMNRFILVGWSGSGYYIDEVPPHGRDGRRINRRGNRQARKRRLQYLRTQTYQQKHRKMYNISNR